MVPAGDNRVRAKIAESENVSTLYSMQSIIDVPDIVESLADVSISATGTRLTLTKPFRVIVAVNLTLQDDAGTAETAKVLDKSVSQGPLIECYNSSGTAVAGTVDAVVVGY